MYRKLYGLRAQNQEFIPQLSASLIRLTAFLTAALLVMLNLSSAFAQDAQLPLRGLEPQNGNSSSSASGSPTTGAVPDTAVMKGPDNDTRDRAQPSVLPHPLTLQQGVQTTIIDHPLTIKAAVEFAEENYPNILKSQAQMRAARDNITVQKIHEYMPDSLMQYQELMASHNKLSQVFFGSPVFPAIAGPGFNNVNMDPSFFSAGGLSLDWAPLDFGLHKARIQVSKTQSQQAVAQYAATKLDVCLAAANAFLDCLVAMEQLRAAHQNEESFLQFSQVVHARVNSSLKPGADASLADAQLANARNDVIRASLAYELVLANLGNTLGVGGRELQIDPRGLATTNEPADLQRQSPLFDNVPILQASRAALDVARAQRRVLDKEYYPVFHFLGGFNMRGSGISVTGRSTGQDVNGLFPLVPNYQTALIINWNFLDIFIIKAQKKVQNERIAEQRQDMSLVLQNLKTQDLQSRARVKAALALAANMPIQVNAASMAASQAEARYKTGLGSVAQVAEANQVLAQSRAQEAIARVGVWRALLAVASVHGDIKPFLAEADRVQRGM